MDFHGEKRNNLNRTESKQAIPTLLARKRPEDKEAELDFCKSAEVENQVSVLISRQPGAGSHRHGEASAPRWTCCKEFRAAGD